MSRSSTEAEYRALAHTTAELTWLTMLLKDLYLSSSIVPSLWCDNISAIALANNPVFHTRSKHIEVDCHFIREKLSTNQLTLQHISSFDQLADLFTKSLHVSRFLFLRDKLMVVSPLIRLRGDDKYISDAHHNKPTAASIG